MVCKIKFPPWFIQKNSLKNQTNSVNKQNMSPQLLQYSMNGTKEIIKEHLVNKQSAVSANLTAKQYLQSLRMLSIKLIKTGVTGLRVYETPDSETDMNPPAADSCK